MAGHIKITTLCYIINDNNEVLLAMKKRDFGQGKWNGVGGKVEAGESPIQAAIREVKEEVGLKIDNPQELGYIEFIWPEDKKDWNQQTYIYLAKDYSGELCESDECLPQWFAPDKIPYDQMWADDIHWYPAMLAGEAIKKRFYFNSDFKVVKQEEI